MTEGVVEHLIVTCECIAEGPNVWNELTDGEYIGVDFGMNLQGGALS